MLQAGTMHRGGRARSLGIRPDARQDEDSPSNGSAAALMCGGRVDLQLINLPHRGAWVLLPLHSVPP